MTTTVTNIQFIFDNGYPAGPTKVNINYIMQDDTDKTSITGNIRLEFTEYVAVMSDMTALGKAVAQELIDKLTTVVQ
ncbi:hypothetical protein SFC08_01755 [Lysinibacillus halotolerans]